MDTLDIGHRETQTGLPDPLQSVGFWNAGAWALPAAMLSWASACVFVVMLGTFKQTT